jgi:hypothetical protein
MTLSAQQSLGQFNDDLVEATMQYDLTTLLISTLTVRNDGTFGTLTYTIINRSDQSLFTFGGFVNPGTLDANLGSHTFNVAPAGLIMTTITGPRGDSLQMPVEVQIGWTSALAK